MNLLSEKIHLTENDFLTRGSHNLVYRHPENPDYLVKVLGIVKVLGLIPGSGLVKGLEHRLENSRWIGNLKILRVINQFRLSKAHVREFMEFVRMRFHDEFLTQPPPFMQKVCGFVDTNLGLAMVVKAEKGKEGGYAPTLSSLIKNKQFDEKAKTKLEQLYEQVRSYDFVLSDLHTDNLVYAYNESLEEHFVIIDGIGDKNIVPILRISPHLRKLKKNRSINYLKGVLEKNYPNPANSMKLKS